MNPFDVTGFLGSAGLIGLVLLIFIETGLLVGFIFPGDSILFTAGIFAAQPTPFAQLWQLLLFLPIAAILGDQCGYALGRYAGPRVMRGRVMNFIGQGPVDKTYAFFDKYGPFTVLFARFIGIVRTLVPVLAGFSKMDHRKFTIFSVLGSILWCDGIVLLGYFLGGVPFLRNNLEVLFIGSALTIIVPIAITVITRRRARKRESAEAAPVEPATR
ncbi:DedA family protein [Tsukamurella paurometabola]|uniref:SNARE associated Golgi protein n=1 Tax=Tsukamurella paurometabola TaxID=2061 RepID=A0A3P8L7D3_TSUPA|nr:DedA family protein [Tsukamurella paurometabola]UEA82333.1 DedA family protein [Tsukamurella paurometabola]VDR39381.1 SNARE associated Golgi protein [Tsukamurella paurometabola]